MRNTPNIWYSFAGGNFDEQNKGYYNTEEIPWVKLLESNISTIKKEIDVYLEKEEKNIKAYFNKDLVTQPKKWKGAAFFFWMWSVNKNKKKCPETMRILNQIPHIVSASISILEPEATINPHRGDTNATYRCHLGLAIPKGLPECGFEVAGEKRSWQEGKALVFNDAARHFAWNHTNKRRYLLLVDVIRPEFASKKYKICSTILGSLLTQSLLLKVPFLKHLPKTIRRILINFFAVILTPFLRIRNIK